MSMERSFIHDPTRTILMYVPELEVVSCGDVGDARTKFPMSIRRLGREN